MEKISCDICVWACCRNVILNITKQELFLLMATCDQERKFFYNVIKLVTNITNSSFTTRAITEKDIKNRSWKAYVHMDICPALDDLTNRCKVYANRPEACKSMTVWWDNCILARKSMDLEE